jgi:glycosyltransferase involved in cell wall biosynthesis
MVNDPAKGIPTGHLRLPKVSIVILNHNYGRYVGQCISSVDAQDYPDIQCIVLDCASSDDSIEVIEATLGRAERPIFTFQRRDFNHGHALNYLSALDDVDGTFVTFLDADDFLFPDFVSTHVRAHLNSENPAALSVTDQVQVDATGGVLAGGCHWHQKWRAYEAGSIFTDVTEGQAWASGLPLPLPQSGHPRLHYAPAWWSSWVGERWIWSALSGIMFRKSVVECLRPQNDGSDDLTTLSMDTYFARFAHAAGGTLMIDGARGAYRRHGSNKWSGNPLLGGRTPTSRGDPAEKFALCQRVARRKLVTDYTQLRSLLGGELYYSLAWQLMSNTDFMTFARSHGDDELHWERTIKSAGARHLLHASPPATSASPTRAASARLASGYVAARSGFKRVARAVASTVAERGAEGLAAQLYYDLDDGQRAEICFPWDYQDPERGLLRKFIANHWQVTRPVITSAFFSSRQQRLIRQIFESLLDPAWRAPFTRQLADDNQGDIWGRHQSVAFFGTPGSGPWQFAITGRHLTLRTGSRQSQVFGGPIVYGHAANGFFAEAGHPGNIFWPQAKAASRLFDRLDQAQRSIAEIDALPVETAIGFDTVPVGLPARLLSAEQKEQLNDVLQSLMAPFRAKDRKHIAECLARQGGMDALHIAFSRANRISAPDWDNWRLQGPSFVWHWRGWPHVHVWVNIGDDAAVTVDARSGTYIFPEHDPLE